MTKKLFREEIFPKPSDAILSMVAELRSPRFVIDMSTFGETLIKELCQTDPDQPVCFGCAATATVVNKLGVKDYGQLYQEYDLADFEEDIDSLRVADASPLLEYYQVDEEVYNWAEYYCEYHLPALDDEYTQDNLDDYEAFAMELQAKGW